jgi:hypothetical protein
MATTKKYKKKKGRKPTITCDHCASQKKQFGEVWRICLKLP